MLPTPKLPYFELNLPSSGIAVKFRPFTMAEEKLLLIALEGSKEIEIIDAVHQIVSTCTDGVMHADTSPMFDVQYAFLQIRAKSVAEIVEFVVQCGGCSARVDSSIDISKIAVEFVPGHNKKIELTTTMGVIMKYPTIRHLDVLSNYTTPEEIYQIIAECIETVYDSDEVYSASGETKEYMVSWIEGLPLYQYNKIQEFFKTMPVLRYDHKFTCPKCQLVNTLSLEGIESFFV